MSEDKNKTAFIGGLLLGGSLGAIASIFFTPRSGKENRQMLKKTAQALPEMAEDLSSTLKINSNRLSASALDNWEHTLTRLKVAIAAGLEASKEETNQEEEEK
ncbi:YtxH domain-containing protein [Cyanobacterium stanieri LEGE 03274]|uniref:YtxH domain-containing protein n=1 Tax=Cyanobacterium stanieri LEGE 03274 TaxID=1828756 RepID=A0ABR9UZZ2_9CHRO|nr:YtxH domain-containing protein [Cyanobacterium stanieri]MBE9221195.1 YtxH domain-containing protein [Cyanobacterium stanieri LEGE 03274]